MHVPRSRDVHLPDVPVLRSRPGRLCAGVGLLLAVLAAAPVFAAGEAAVPAPGLELSHVDRLGEGSMGLVLRSVEYVLDGAPLEMASGPRWELAPGVHVLGVRVVYEGRSALFGYLDGYRFVMQGQVTFEARPGYTLALWSTGFAREGWMLRWEDRPGFRIEGQPRRDILSIESGPVRYDSLEQARAAPAPRAPEVASVAPEEAREPPEPEEPCRMEPVRFDFEDSRLKPEAQEALVALSRCLLRQPAWRVRLEGHGDARGSESVNVSLGLGRALTVAGYLWSLGVPREQLEVGTQGTERRVCEERTEACFSRSRRVELLPLAH